ANLGGGFSARVILPRARAPILDGAAWRVDHLHRVAEFRRGAAASGAPAQVYGARVAGRGLGAVLHVDGAAGPGQALGGRRGSADMSEEVGERRRLPPSAIRARSAKRGRLALSPT